MARAAVEGNRHGHLPASDLEILCGLLGLMRPIITTKGRLVVLKNIFIITRNFIILYSLKLLLKKRNVLLKIEEVYS